MSRTTIKARDAAAPAQISLLSTLESGGLSPPPEPTAASPTSRQLQLERPIVCVDLETTGLNVNEDRIVELSCVKVQPNQPRELLTLRLNPGRSISPEASAVHGIRDEDVQSAPTFAAVAARLVAFLQGADLTGFNLEGFDLPLLAEEFRRVGVVFPAPDVRVVDSYRIFLTKEPRDLSSAYQFYCGKTLANAHSAEADAVAAADILEAQVARYADVPITVAELHDFCHPTRPEWLDPAGKIVWREGGAALGFGKHRHQSLETLARDNPGYLRWIISSDFSPEVTAIVKEALDGHFPARPAALDESPG